MGENLYPPSVQGVPPDLTRPNAAYRRQVIIVLLSLVIFVLFYFGLIAFSSWGIFYCLTQALGASASTSQHTDSGNGYLALALLSGVLLLFLLKALLKWRKQEDGLRIEITAQEHPELFSFIHRICEDTRAPFPYKVFLTSEVNAAVFYNSSLLSLFLPVPKNLLIGLGLVNGLNLSEFKAVLAHEFGHFSQSSMRLGSYVYMANRVIYDLVYHRDQFDELLAQARRVNGRIAGFAYLITFVLWILRQVLQLAFKVINFFESALSRQMEFHADLVAVSVTGSDSLIHALKKLDFVNACQMQAFHALKDASEHKLYTQDLFYHQTQAAEHLRRTLEKPDFGVVPSLPADPTQKTQLFNREDEDNASKRRMWLSHPSDYDREQNAKRHYIRSVEDTRSPWILFRNSEQLRHRMTERFYQTVLEHSRSNFAPPEQVQAYIDEEHNETTQNLRYLGLYDGRLLSIPTERLTEYANDPDMTHLSEARIKALLDKLYHAEYKEWLEAHVRRQEEIALLHALNEGKAKIKGSTFTFRDKPHKQTDVKSLLEMVAQEMKADEDWLAAFDREVFQVHLYMAQSNGEGDRDLYERYYFHLYLQDILQTARQEEIRLLQLFQFLSTKKDGLSQAEHSQANTMLEQTRKTIQKALVQARSLPLPSLHNMQAGVSLDTCLLQEPLLERMGDQTHISSDWANALMKQVSQIEERCRRLYFKSMGAILIQQEAVTQRYRGTVLDTGESNENSL